SSECRRNFNGAQDQRTVVARDASEQHFGRRANEGASMNISTVTTRNAILGVALAACYASAADAAIIYSLPTTTNVTTQINNNIIVDNNSAVVNVNSGGIIRGVSDPSLGMYNAAARTKRGTLNVTGTGRIIAGR